MTKFTSNCKKVLDALPPPEISMNALINIDDSNMERALGMLWDVQSDVFIFASVIKDFDQSKRGILKCSSSIFDPRGFLGPFIMKARQILQELWKLLCDWDEPIEGKPKLAWEAWVAGAQKVSVVRIPRQYNCDPRPVVEWQLHVFCDASEAAFGCVTYIRFSYKDGGHSCSFVMSKSLPRQEPV